MIASDLTAPPPEVPGGGGGAGEDQTFASSTNKIRTVLRIHDFRWLWISLALSSTGDWLGLLAKTALATDLVHSYRAANFALGGVLVAQLLPAVLFGPLAGAFADRFDRRRTMVLCDVLRFALFVSIPILGSLIWLFVASFLIECLSLFWIPAKEASVPNLLNRKDQIESANQLSLITTYGITPVVAAALFAVLAWTSKALALAVPFFKANQVDLAFYFNALTFLVAAITVARIKRIGGKRAPGSSVQNPGILRLMRDGLAFVGHSPMVRGLLIGILGAFAAAGTVIGTGKIYSASLGGGDAAYGLLFGAIFVGLGLGMAFGPRIARELSRRRLFGIAIVFAGACLVLMAFMPLLVLAITAIVGVGFGGGIAYLSGMTLIGSEVEDDVRGRTFALVQSLVRVVLILTLAAVPFLVGVVRQQQITIGSAHITIDGTRFLLVAAGLLAVLVGILAYRQMDDRNVVPLVADLVSAFRGDSTKRRRLTQGGFFVAFEGGEGVGKTTQIERLAEHLRTRGVAVVSTHEPGATDTGGKVRQILLNRGDAALSPRAEALLFAADRADHVDTVIRPALESGAVVLTDRYVDSSLAYQGAGRALALDEIRQLSKWATDGLRPDVTVLLDLDPEIGLARVDKRGVADRLEQESLDFHRRVREAFGSLAESNPDAYLVLPADRDPDILAGEVAAVIDGLLRARGIPAPEAEEGEVDAADPVDEDRDEDDENRDEDDGGVAEPMSRPTPATSQDRSELERKR
jgi:dTMP kinase